MKTSKTILKIPAHTIIMGLCLCIFIYSAVNIAKRLSGYYKNNKHFKEIKTMVDTRFEEHRLDEIFKSAIPEIKEIPMQQLSETEERKVIPYMIEYGDTSDLDASGILSEYVKLKNINNDLIGWIQIPGFKKMIDYPVMYRDNEYYLNKDFYQNYSYSGSIFMDIRNKPQSVDRHIIIYGHAMKDMSMFGNLKDYPENEEEQTQIRKIYLDLLNTRLEYEVFSTYYEHASFNYRQTEFGSDEEYLAFIENIHLKSVYDYNIVVSPEDKILTLSTCNNDLFRDGRSIIHARLVRQILYKECKDGYTSGISSFYNDDIDNNKEAVSANVYLIGVSLLYRNPDEQMEAVLVPSFAPQGKEYKTILPAYAENVILVYEKADENANVTVALNEEPVDILKPLELKADENVIVIRTVSRDLQYVRNITIRVLKESSSGETDIPEETDRSNDEERLENY
jgi:sortase B